MTSATIIPATREHAEALAGRVRQPEVEELSAASGETPLEALLSSMAASSDARALLLGDEVAAVYGIVPIGNGAAVIWLLTSAAVERYPITFMKSCIAEISRYLNEFDALVNFIDARYERSLRWAARIGAEVTDARPFGCEGRLFHPVMWRRSS